MTKLELCNIIEENEKDLIKLKGQNDDLAIQLKIITTKYKELYQLVESIYKNTAHTTSIFYEIFTKISLTKIKHNKHMEDEC